MTFVPPNPTPPRAVAGRARRGGAGRELGLAPVHGASGPGPPGSPPAAPRILQPAERTPLTQLLRLQPERGGDGQQQGQEARAGGPRQRCTAGAGLHGLARRQLGKLGLPSTGPAPWLPGAGRLLSGRAPRRREPAQPLPRIESHWGGPEPSGAGASPGRPAPSRLTRRPPRRKSLRGGDRRRASRRAWRRLRTPLGIGRSRLHFALRLRLTCPGSGEAPARSTPGGREPERAVGLPPPDGGAAHG